jgi:hypothetical protein
VTCVKFKEHLLVTGSLDHTIEDCFHSRAAFAGIHSFNFDDEFVDAGTDITEWDDGGAQATWTSTGGRIRGVGDGAGSTLYGIHSVSDMPKTFVLKLTYYANANKTGSVGVLATDESNLIWVRWNATQVMIQEEASGTLTNLCVLPKTVVGDRVVTISVQPDDEDTQGCYVSCWFDEVFVINAHLTSYPAGRKLALGTYEGETTEYDDFRIAELTELLPVTTIDAGETPLGSLRRALGRRHINYFTRWNGELRAWRPKAVTAALTITASPVYTHDEQVDRRGLISHWRQVGARDVADAYDETLLEEIGHRFRLDENPDLMTEDDCSTEAEYNLDRVQEYAHLLAADMPLMVFLEPEDRITIRTVDWLLSNYGVGLKAGSFPLQADLRKYIY